MSDPALGMLMLGLIVVVIMMGFPTAFTLMGLGMVFGFGAFYDPSHPWWDNKIFNLMVQRTFGAMTNDTLLSIPLFVLMGYIMERGALVDKMFHSVQLAFRKVPGSLAVTTLVICTFWGIASGLVGAVVVLMGVIAMRPMLNAGYDTRLASGVITAGGTLGILIPPSVMIIVYAAVAGQSVVKLYAAAMFPGFFLAFLYLVYIIGWVLIDPKIAPKLPEDQLRAPLRPWVAAVKAQLPGNMLISLIRTAWTGLQGAQAPSRWLAAKAVVMALSPVILAGVCLGAAWWYVVIHSAPDPDEAPAAPVAALSVPAGATDSSNESGSASALATPPGTPTTETKKAEGGLQEPPGAESVVKKSAGGLQEPPGAEDDKSSTPTAKSGGLQEPPGAAAAESPPAAAIASAADAASSADASAVTASAPAASAAPLAADAHVPENFYAGFTITCLFTLGLLLYYYRRFDAEQFEIVDMLVRSVAPLGILTLVVLGVILFGITTATESAAVGAAGAFLMAWRAGTLNLERIKESVFLTAKTTSMVCWLFVGSALFSAVFAILGGQRLVEEWVMALNLTPIQFMLLSQAIIFILGWPLEWTEIIVIFVPIFLPLLTHFQIDPILWGVMVFVNLQAAFLSPPVAMSAFYLKGVCPPHVTINQIFAGMMPYMLIVILCLVIIYLWPGLTLWLPNFLYGGGG